MYPVFPLPATPTGWPVPEFFVPWQLANVNVDTYKFLYNSGLHCLVFAVSFVVNFHVPLKNFKPHPLTISFTFEFSTAAFVMV